MLIDTVFPALQFVIIIKLIHQKRRHAQQKHYQQEQGSTVHLKSVSEVVELD